MKKYIIATLIFPFFACNRLEVDNLDFNVVAENNIVKAGQPVNFQFTGDPDYITFYSGEIGHRYEKRENTEISVEDIKTVNMSFSVKSKYGPDTEFIRVYLSTDFPGLTGDYQIDKDNIQTETYWTDITEQCGLRTMNETSTSNEISVSVNIDMKEYISGFVLAFRYLGHHSSSYQKTVTIGNFKMDGEYSNGVKTTYMSDINGLGFKPFDINPSNLDGDAYLFGTKGNNPKGTWDFSTINGGSVKITGGKNEDKNPTYAENDDWLISGKVVINKCDPETGVAIKNMNVNLPSYQYIYTVPGIYKATFDAGNITIDGESKVLREVEIIVEE